MATHRFGGLAAIVPTSWSLSKGLRGGLGCCVPLLLAEWLGQSQLSWAAMIGFWVVLVDPGWPPRSRFVAIVSFVLGTAAACFLATLVGPYPWAAALFALVFSSAAVLTRVWGDTAGSTGTLIAILVLIILGLHRPASFAAAGAIAGMSLAGGAWGMLLAYALGRSRPDAPVRAALAAVFRAEAAFARELLTVRASAEARDARRNQAAVLAAIEAARAALVDARRGWVGPTRWGRRAVLMLADADRAMASLLAIRGLLADAAILPVPQGALGAMAQSLDAIAAQVEAAPAGVAPPPALDLTAENGAADVLAAPLHSAAAWIGAAAGHLAAVAPAERAAEPAPDDRTTTLLSQLGDNLSFDSLSLRHALRFGVTAGGLTLVTNGLQIDRGYWITLTAVIVLQTYPSAAWQRAIQRVAGSVAGGLIAAGTAFVLHGPAEVTLVIMPLSILAMALRTASYALYIICITPMFILMTELFSNGGVLTPTLGALRIVDSLIGAALGLAATVLLWPSWEQRYLRRRLAEDVRRNGGFLVAALAAGEPDEASTARARRGAGLAANNAEASLQRALDEPRRRSAEEIGAAMTVTASARRLGEVAAALAALPARRPEGLDKAATRSDLQEQLDDIAGAIEQARAPAPRPPIDRAPATTDILASEIHRARRQLAVLREAATDLAARRAAG